MVSLLLVVLMFQIPLLLVYGVGVVLAITSWRRHRAVSALVLIVIAGSVLQSVLNVYLNLYLPSWLLARDARFSEAALISTVRNFINAVLDALWWGLLLAAIFGWRKSPSQETRE